MCQAGFLFRNSTLPQRLKAAGFKIEVAHEEPAGAGAAAAGAGGAADAALPTPATP